MSSVWGRGPSSDAAIFFSLLHTQCQDDMGRIVNGKRERSVDACLKMRLGCVRNILYSG